MKVILSYTLGDGAQKRIRFDNTILGINRRGLGIADINLAPFKSCKNLRSLNLGNNQLESIDLSFLESCSNLQLLNLQDNDLRNVDLSPLSSCNHLQKLWLNDNQLHSLNLSPLGKCQNLMKLLLNGNRLKSIDLKPLCDCSNLQELCLYGNQLTSIDLTPLSACSSLEELHLSGNLLQSIDLTPLSLCTNLQLLHLNGNQINGIDLTPLRTCSNLQTLWISRNKLKSIDLSTLSSCTKLHSLRINDNPIESIIAHKGNDSMLDLSSLRLSNIDLSNLSSHTELRHLDISKNNLLSIDVTPLSPASRIRHDSSCEIQSWLQRKDAVYARPTGNYRWSFLHEVLCEQGKDRRILLDTLYALGLGKYGYIDYDIRDFLLSIPPETQIDAVREQTVDMIVDLITTTVDKGGATTGFRLEELTSKHGDIAVRAHRILELREEEMKQVRLSLSYDSLDLRELYLTSYGYDILTAMSLNLTTGKENLVEIKKTFSSLGFRLKISKTYSRTSKMSNELRHAIWWMVENRGRPWKHIP